MKMIELSRLGIVSRQKRFLPKRSWHTFAILSLLSIIFTLLRSLYYSILYYSIFYYIYLFIIIDNAAGLQHLTLIAIGRIKSRNPWTYYYMVLAYRLKESYSRCVARWEKRHHFDVTFWPLMVGD